MSKSAQQKSSQQHVSPLSDDGRLALTNAAGEGDVDSVRSILRAVERMHGREQAELAARSRSIIGSSMMEDAAHMGHAAVLRILHVEFGVPVDLDAPKRWTALQTAAYYGQLECVKLLVAHGAALSYRDTSYKRLTALEYAREKLEVERSRREDRYREDLVKRYAEVVGFLEKAEQQVDPCAADRIEAEEEDNNIKNNKNKNKNKNKKKKKKKNKNKNKNQNKNKNNGNNNNSNDNASGDEKASQ